VWHWSDAEQVTGLPPVQTPAWQLDVPVQMSLSLHALPLALGGFEHAPVSAPQAPASWHWLDAEQLMGLAPVHFWLWQVEVPLHALWSSQAKPFAFPVHCPHGILIFAVAQSPGMKQCPALPLKKNSLFAAHFALNCQWANGNRNVACPLVFVFLLFAAIPSSEVGVTALPDTGAPAPSTTVTRVGALTRMLADVHPGTAQSKPALL
jgi:hypothetical protein